MTDQEILNAFNAAEDKKQAVKTLAEQNGVGIWDMMQTLTDLKAPGLDRRWYQNLNPARPQPKKSDAGGDADTDYLKKIIAQQDKILKDQNAAIQMQQQTIETLKSEICKADEEFRDLQAELQAEKNKKQSTGKLELISAFCTGMSGTGAWLMGRFVELLLQWRDFGDAAELRDFLADYYETGEKS